jgi:hypothetical protein
MPAAPCFFPGKSSKTALSAPLSAPPLEVDQRAGTSFEEPKIFVMRVVQVEFRENTALRKLT